MRTTPTPIDTPYLIFLLHAINNVWRFFLLVTKFDDRRWPEWLPITGRWAQTTGVARRPRAGRPRLLATMWSSRRKEYRTFSTTRQWDSTRDPTSRRRWLARWVDWLSMRGQSVYYCCHCEDAGSTRLYKMRRTLGVLESPLAWRISFGYMRFQVLFVCSFILKNVINSTKCWSLCLMLVPPGSLVRHV